MYRDKKQDFIAILFQTHIYGKLQFLLKARKIDLLFNEKRSLGFHVYMYINH